MRLPNSDHQARKRFGQNFLVDQNIINLIIRSIAPKADQNLVEIGPGQGAITTHLLSANEKLQVIEIDRDLIPVLEAEFRGEHPDFTIHQADALRFDYQQLATTENPMRVIGNLPYNISTPLIFHLLGFATLIHDMHFMLQKEVVQRITAKPGEKNYGRLTVITQYHCKAEYLFDVSPNCFRPKPKVDSAIVRLTPHQEKPFSAKNEKRLDQIVKGAFSQRRKTIRNSLKNIVPPEIFKQLELDDNLRAENLSVETYVNMANLLEEKDA